MRRKYKSTIHMTTALFLGAILFTACYYYTEKTEVNRQHQIRQRRLSYVTRDPHRHVTFSYQTSCNQSTNMKVSKVDLSLGIQPDLTTLDRQMVIVLGFGSRKMYKGMGCVASIQSHMPFKKIIVYDLGIHPKMVKKLRQMCNVEIRKVPFTRYPKHVRKTENHAWIILELFDILKEYGAFFHIKPDMRLRAPISMLLPHIIQQNGILTDLEKDNTTTQVTHPDVFQYLGMSIADFERNFPDAPLATRFIAGVNNTVLTDSIWQPIIECALDLDCIEPYGSEYFDIEPDRHIHTHKYEFSLLTLLLYRTFKDQWIPNSDTRYMVERLYDLVDPDFSHDYLWAHFCNPPQNEIDCTEDGGKKCH